MGQHRIVEFRRLLDAAGRALPGHGEDVAWLGSLLEMLTTCRVGSRWERAAAPCPTRGCAGALALRRIGDACEWFCASCASGGAIVGWRNSPWDLTELEAQDEVDRSDALLFARLSELAAVRRATLPRPLRLALALAAVHADYVVVPLAASELPELAAAVEGALAHAAGQAEAHLLARFAGRVDAALLAQEARSDEPPTLH